MAIEGTLTAMPARDQRLMLAAAFATSAALLVAALSGHAELLSYAAPVYLVAVPLLAGRYVGEERLERMRSCLPQGRRLPPRGIAPRTGRRIVASLPRGGRLIAHSLAERPPPLARAS
jgi:hypothetical protein